MSDDFKDPEWLFTQLEEKKRKQQDIAEECEVTQPAVSYWARKHQENGDWPPTHDDGATEQQPNPPPEDTPTVDLGTSPIDDISSFRMAILAILTDGPMVGQRALEQLERDFGTDINHSRFYQNTDNLCENGHLTRRTSPVDARGRLFETTDEGAEIVKQWASWLVDRVSGDTGLGSDVPDFNDITDHPIAGDDSWKEYYDTAGETA